MKVPVSPGDLVAEKYRVEQVIGEGGMGIVVAATHVDLNRRVALKFLLPERLGSGANVRRFEREARAAAALKSDHVASVLDVGQVDDDTPYIVMEYLEGRDLAVVLRDSDGLVVEAAVAYLLQACEAMAEAHSAHIVHRDLKPANLFLTTRPDGRPLIKVLDFGVSKLIEENEALTQSAGTVGSPLYMSPEQLESSRDVDHRSDIWALGAILFELLTSKPPFSESSVAKVYVRILQTSPDDLSSRRSDVPEALEHVVLRCLEKDRSRRFPTVADLAAALVPFAPPWAAVHAAAAARIIAGSTLSHDDLPPASAIDEAVTNPTPDAARTPAASTTPTTVDHPRRADPPGDRSATSADGSWVQEPDEGSSPARRRGVLLAVGAVSLGAAGLWFALGDRGGEPAVGEASVASAPMAAVPAPASAAEPEEKLDASTPRASTPASATPPAPSSAKPIPARRNVVKPRPRPASKAPTEEEFFKHRR